MPNVAYDAAHAIADAADPSEFTPPPYTGAVDDLVYLRQWVLDQVTSLYGLPADAFDLPTVMSTSLLRDFVHRALYQTTDPNFAEDVRASPEYLGSIDVASGFRYPMHGLCGDMAFQLWQVYRAFDYQADLIWTIDNDVTNYFDTHAMVDVYLYDLGETVVQDPTYNYAYQDASGALLSFHEARQAIMDGDQVDFGVFTNYRDFYIGVTQTALTPEFEAYIKANYLGTLYLWETEAGLTGYTLDSLFLDARTAHIPGSSQGGTVADQAAALALLNPWVGGVTSWADVAAELRSSGYYVSGFSLGDGASAAEWLTLRLANGEYVSISLDTGQILRGSFDQLSHEAIAGPSQNPGVDLSDWLETVRLLALDGTVFDLTVPKAPLDYQFGDAGSNTLRGGDGDDRLFGYGGDDFYVVNSTSDRANETAGNGYDTIATNVSYVLAAGSSIEALTTWGSATTDPINLTGNELDNLLVGNRGANILDGGAGADSMWGGEGNDIYLVDDVYDHITEVLGAGYDTVITNVSYTLPHLASIEVMTTYGTATTDPINLTGNGYANLLIGNDGANVLDGGGGADDLWGYGGDDTYILDNVGDVVNEAANGGYDTIVTNNSYVLAAGVSVEVLKTYGSATTTAINLTGNEISNLIVGNNAANIIDGGGGADSMWGAGGDDTYHVDHADDLVIEYGGAGYDVVYTTISYVLAAGQEIETLAVTDALTTWAINLTGNGFNNNIAGNNGANVIIGGGGADHMWGYGGDDVYYVDQADDAAYEVAGGGYDTVITNVSYTLAAGQEIEALTTWSGVTTQNVNLTGNEFDNLIVGNAGMNTLDGGGGNDVIWGYGGDDILDGGAGNDTLKGGDGADRFVFAASNAGADVIIDFETAVDRFSLAAGEQFTAASTSDVNGDGVLDTVLTHAGGTVTIYGWAGVAASDDLSHWNGLTIVG